MENYDKYAKNKSATQPKLNPNLDSFLAFQNRYSRSLCNGIEWYFDRTNQCYHPIRRLKGSTSRSRVFEGPLSPRPYVHRPKHTNFSTKLTILGIYFLWPPFLDIDFTVGANEKLVTYLMNTLRNIYNKH